MRRLVWLASYPKSGNTWLRVVLSNLDPTRDEPVGLGGLGAGIAARRDRFDALTGVESSDLDRREVDTLRPMAFATTAGRAPGAEPIFWKIHDGFLSPATGAPLVPVQETRGAIYLVRDPRDVVISFANHSGWTLDKTIQVMGTVASGLTNRADRAAQQLPQHLGSWSEHVTGWLDQELVPVHLLRYEALLADPVEGFAGALEFAGEEVEQWVVERAVEWARFDRLQGQEISKGFAEKPSSERAFFRSGVAEEWRERLTSEQVRRVESDHGSAMRRLGYAMAHRDVV